MAAIEKKVDALTTKFDEHSRRDLEQLDTIAQWIAKIDQRFDGTNGTPGLTVRIDRLEQRQEDRSRAFWWAMGIMGSAIAAEAGVLIHFLNK